MSGCIDINGNKLEDALTYDKDNNKASVNTTNTSYCYLYFSKIIINAETLPDISSDIWESPLESDGYRYVGTSPNNYICFGTTDKNTCIGDYDLYMYRIIGMFEDSEGISHFKLIKNTPLHYSYDWGISIKWGESELYNGINGNYFLNNTTYSYMQNSKWLEKIADWNWVAVNTKSWSDIGVLYSYNTSKTIYLHELNRSTKVNQTCYDYSLNITDCSIGEWNYAIAKIGLIYVSDFTLSLGESVLDLIISDNENTFKSGWLNLDSSSVVGEATISISGSEGSQAYGYYIKTGGVWEYTLWSLSNRIRPVFYLKSDVKITGGTGTLDDPFIIS